MEVICAEEIIQEQTEPEICADCATAANGKDRGESG
jgi:hypothetical protein